MNVEKQWKAWNKVTSNIFRATTREVIKKEISTEEDIEAIRKHLKVQTEKKTKKRNSEREQGSQTPNRMARSSKHDKEMDSEGLYGDPPIKTLKK